MKFDLYPSQERKALLLPGAALKLAGLGGEEKLSAHVSSSTVTILKDKMNAREMAAAIGALNSLSIELTVKLSLACGDCDGCECCEDAEKFCDCYCDGCEDDCEDDCCGLEVPPCLLRQAGIPLNAGLDVEFDGGRVVITAAECKPDPLDAIPEVLMYTFSKSGYCLGNLRELLESGEIIDG
jgi:hypothetical protein